jgi:hypothetical protein
LLDARIMAAATLGQVGSWPRAAGRGTPGGGALPGGPRVRSFPDPSRGCGPRVPQWGAEDGAPWEGAQAF